MVLFPLVTVENNKNDKLNHTLLAQNFGRFISQFLYSDTFYLTSDKFRTKMSGKPLPLSNSVSTKVHSIKKASGFGDI